MKILFCEPSMGNLLQEFRYAFRVLWKNRIFTIAATLTLALGIGANPAIFTAVDEVLLRPLPYSDASHLVSVYFRKAFSASGVTASMSLSSDIWRQVREQSRVFAQLATYSSGDFTLTGQTEPERIRGARVSGDFFSLLGERTVLGRPILPTDIEPGHEYVALLSYAIWNELGDDPRILGQDILLMDDDTKLLVSCRRSSP